MGFTFTKATKKKLKLRLALCGPTGSGKTYTALRMARELAKGGVVAVIDTEHSSASLYADDFDFVAGELNHHSPRSYCNAINAAAEAGVAVLIIDSLTHAWTGNEGALELVDQAAARNRGNSYVAWRDVTPMHNELVNAILSFPGHIICTMRSKMEYVQEKDSRGKTVIRKVGMAPIQRAGMEYEFTVVADIDVDHKLIVTKSRCKAVTDAVIKEAGEPFAATLLEWLERGEDDPRTTPASDEQIAGFYSALDGLGLSAETVDGWAKAVLGWDDVTKIPAPQLRATFAKVRAGHWPDLYDPQQMPPRRGEE